MPFGWRRRRESKCERQIRLAFFIHKEPRVENFLLSFQCRDICCLARNFITINVDCMLLFGIFTQRQRDINFWLCLWNDDLLNGWMSERASTRKCEFRRGICGISDQIWGRHLPKNSLENANNSFLGRDWVIKLRTLACNTPKIQNWYTFTQIRKTHSINYRIYEITQNSLSLAQ